MCDESCGSGCVIEKEIGEMIFESLSRSAELNELILVEGGYLRWHLRRDGHITIYEIIAIKPGAGSKMLEIIKQQDGKSVLARCPSDLEANEWWAKKGFILEKTEQTKSGRTLNCWRLPLST